MGAQSSSESTPELEKKSHAVATNCVSAFSCCSALQSGLDDDPALRS